MKNILRWLEVAFLLAPFVLIASYWSELPARIPVHWNFSGEIDRWESKGWGMFFLPCVSIVIVALTHFLPRLDPRLRRTNSSSTPFRNALEIIALAESAFFFFLFLVVLFAARGIALPTSRIISSSMLLLLAVIGNYLGILRPNYFIGIRTPWTLTNPETWRATHRLGARLMVFGSIALLIAQFFLNERSFVLAVFGAIILLALWSLIYSWHHARNHAAAVERS